MFFLRKEDHFKPLSSSLMKVQKVIFDVNHDGFVEEHFCERLEDRIHGELRLHGYLFSAENDRFEG